MPPSFVADASGDGAAAAGSSPPKTWGMAVTPAVMPATTPAAIIIVANTETVVVRGSASSATSSARDRPLIGIVARRRAWAAQALPSTAAMEPVSVLAAVRQADGVCAPSGTWPASGTGPLMAAEISADPAGRRTGSGFTASCASAARVPGSGRSRGSSARARARTARRASSASEFRLGPGKPSTDSTSVARDVTSTGSSLWSGSVTRGRSIALPSERSSTSVGRTPPWTRPTLCRAASACAIATVTPAPSAAVRGPRDPTAVGRSTAPVRDSRTSRLSGPFGEMAMSGTRLGWSSVASVSRRRTRRARAAASVGTATRTSSADSM